MLLLIIITLHYYVPLERSSSKLCNQNSHRHFYVRNSASENPLQIAIYSNIQYGKIGNVLDHVSSSVMSATEIWIGIKITSWTRLGSIEK
jgi:hypothetical protein